MVDARDIAEVAAIELIRREQAPGKLPIETINLVGPDTLTGSSVAAIWSEVLGRPVAYGGDDPSGFEQNMATFMPKWMAYEMRLDGRTLCQRRHDPRPGRRRASDQDPRPPVVFLLRDFANETAAVASRL